MEKPFEDMSAIDWHNKYDRYLWFRSAEVIMNNGIDPEELYEGTEPVGYQELLKLFRSNTTMYDKLVRLLGKDYDEETFDTDIYFPSSGVFTTFISTIEKMDFQYSQILATIDSYVKKDIFQLKSDDIKKILKEYDELDEASVNYFRYIGFEKDNTGHYYSIFQSDEDDKQMVDFLDMSNDLYSKHELLKDYIKNFLSRQEMIGRGIPRKYL
jgi:hypothetical protein